MTDKPELFCSFCGKSQYKARRMVAGPEPACLNICDECVDLAGAVVHGGYRIDRIWAIEQAIKSGAVGDAILPLATAMLGLVAGSFKLMPDFKPDLVPASPPEAAA